MSLVTATRRGAGISKHPSAKPILQLDVRNEGAWLNKDKKWPTYLQASVPRDHRGWSPTWLHGRTKSPASSPKSLLQTSLQPYP